MAPEFRYQIRIGIGTRPGPHGVRFHGIFGDLWLLVVRLAHQCKRFVRAGRNAQPAADASVCIERNRFRFNTQGVHLASVEARFTARTGILIHLDHKG